MLQLFCLFLVRENYKSSLSSVYLLSLLCNDHHMIRRAAECVLVIVVVVYLDLFMSTPFLFRAAHYGPRRCSPPKAAAAAAAKAAASLKAVDRLHTFATLTVVVVVFVFEPMKKSHFESLHLSRCCLNQCDQTGQFFKVLGDMVSVKSSPNTW